MPCNDIHYSKDLRIRRWSACTYLKIYKTQRRDLVKWHVRNKSGVYREQGGRAHTTRETVSYPYKNPSGYHDIPRSMIRESCSKGYNIIVIVSDFNAATIDWDSWNDPTYRDIQFIVLLHSLPTSAH
jgi:hypothetical protein